MLCKGFFACDRITKNRFFDGSSREISADEMNDANKIHLYIREEAKKMPLQGRGSHIRN